jgi:hypothetical protein
MGASGRVLDRLLGIAAVACTILLACGSSTPSSPPTGTWMVDCVSVLGIPTPSGQMPLAAVPLSGLPRDVHIGDLSDAQLGHLADYTACLFGNGYRHDCCSDTACPHTVPGDPPIGPFRLETVPLLADALSTCYPTTYGESSSPSRENNMSLDRGTFGNCHVGLYEDCMREQVSAPLADATPSPDCTEFNDLCGALK